jgi:hypothetical protein
MAAFTVDQSFVGGPDTLREPATTGRAKPVRRPRAVAAIAPAGRAVYR